MIRYKEDIITLLVVLATAVFFIFTPGRETLGGAVQGFIMGLIFFGLVPIGYHFLVLKKPRESFGLGAGAWRNRLIVIIPVLALALAATVVAYQLSPGFQQSVVLPGLVTSSFGWFLSYELLLVPVVAALYEIFFRGFIQKSWLEPHFGGLAVLMQSALFMLFLAVTGSFGWVTLPLMCFSLFAGFLLWQNNSLVQTWMTSWLYLLLFDVYLLLVR